MIGTVKLGEKEVEMAANAATPFIYKQLFKKDILVLMDKLQVNGMTEETSDVFVELGFVMAKQAKTNDIKDLMNLKTEDFYTWLTEFEALDVVLASNEIAMIYNGQKESTSVPKSQGD